ncbi:hypothetical protein [Bradyrhizobium sp. BR 1432]|uniref:hypothetical protein n=1 Tax=Bradyrhizobium sp. BR 1432 TaxID=3447966 RepID=UPI003EE71990
MLVSPQTFRSIKEAVAVWNREELAQMKQMAAVATVREKARGTTSNEMSAARSQALASEALRAWYGTQSTVNTIGFRQADYEELK